MADLLLFENAAVLSTSYIVKKYGLLFSFFRS